VKRIYIIGIGPGKKEGMTIEAREALNECDVLCGYTVYIELLKDIVPSKRVISTGMTKEIERCHAALKEAVRGNTVAMICSGDAGVFGMSGLIYQLSVEYDNVEIIPLPGVTAALSGGAILGAPLTHDFAVISLSDLLTPWELIEKRIKFAAMADFCIALYNPSSKKRHDYLKNACEIMLSEKSAETICGYVRNIGREGEEFKIMTLDELKDEKVDMFCTVFIGNSNTKIINGKMVTPRGYEKRMK